MSGYALSANSAANLETEIAAARERRYHMLIDGALVPASDGAEMETINPATGEPIAWFPNASRVDVDRAIQSAKAAQIGWAKRSYSERRDALAEVGRILRDNAERFGLLDTLETGNIYSAMRNEAAYGASAIDYLSAIGFELKGESTQLDSNLHYSRREPYGVVLRLLPFNHPIMTAGSAIAAPLLTGNALILKPSPHSSLSTLLLGELVADLLPPGVLTILSGSTERVAVPLSSHAGVDRISIIGSTDSGRAVMRQAAARLVPLTLELGGKNPMIVLPDADLDLAADTAIANMNFGWQSASCGSTSRIFVHASVRDGFERRLAERIAAVRVDDPFAESAQMGSISFRALYDRCLHYIDAGRAEGARLIVGGERPAGAQFERGLFIKPALFVDATPSMRIAREEIFGPVVTVIEWADWAAMIEHVNELSLALTTVIMGNDLSLVATTANAVQAGYIEVNGPISWALGSPFGGLKESGFGREGNMDELLSYTYTKSVNVRLRSTSKLGEMRPL